MKKYISELINRLYKNDLELLYGEGSYVVLNNIRYITNGHHYSIDCTLHLKDIELFKEIDSSGLDYIIKESWKFTGMGDEKVMLICSYNII